MSRNVAQALDEQYAGLFYSIWTVYRVTKFLLNYQMDILDVAELPQALCELYAGWFYAILTVY